MNKDTNATEPQCVNEEELMKTQDGQEVSETDGEATEAPEQPEGSEEGEKTDAEKLAEAEDMIARLKDQLLRQVAEFDNFRKRTIKEKTELILNGGQKLMEKLLPVLDDLDRAHQNMEQATDVATLKEGVDLIIDKLMKTLSSEGLKKMETEDALFDTDFHEAIALVPAQEEAQKGHIMDCVQPGYMLNEKVIRHAKVVVGQ